MLTNGVFTSGAVKTELRAASEANKPVALVHESDTNKKGCTGAQPDESTGWAPVEHYIETAPPFCPQLFNGHQTLPYQRDYYLLAGFYDKLVARIESRG